MLTVRVRRPRRDAPPGLPQGLTLTVPFLLDSGAQTSVMEPGCAAQLHLRRVGSAGVTGVSGETWATFTQAEVEVSDVWYLIDFIVPSNRVGAQCLLGWNVLTALDLLRLKPGLGVSPESLPVRENCPIT